MDEKPCRICGIVKPIVDFHRRKASKDGRHTACKPCAMAQQKASMGKPPKLGRKPWAPDGMKVCVHCGKTRKMESFPRNRNSYDGRHTTCKSCMKTYQPKYVPGKNRETNSRRYWANPEAARDRRLSAKHGVPIGTYAKMLSAQGGVCAICGRDSNPGKTRFALDHNHVTNEVRGLLCTCCNQAIGQLQDSPDLLRKAAAYLENAVKGLRP